MAGEVEKPENDQSSEDCISSIAVPYYPSKGETPPINILATRAARLRRSIETNRNAPITHFLLAAALAHLGRVEEAKAATQAGLAVDPGFTIRRFRLGAYGDHPVYLAQRQRFYDGMLKAVVPEG